MSRSNEFHIRTNELPSKQMETFFKCLIFYTVGMYVVEELVAGTEHSKEGWYAFLWSERLVAVLFTGEYLLRWYHCPNRRTYPFSLMAVVDAIAIVPFYFGFFVSEETLHLIRTLRILRLLKLYRYSVGLQLLALGFYRAREQLKAIGFATFVLVFVSHAAIFECERYRQPEAFSTLDDAFWFTCVTVTTVGYGDVYPTTNAGRIVSILTFVTGVTLFGTFAGVMGSAFASVLSERLDDNDEHEKTGSTLAMKPKKSDSADVPELIQKKLEILCDQLKDVLGESLVSVVLFGPIAKKMPVTTRSPLNVMLVLQDVSTKSLDKIAPFVERGWREFRLSTLVLTELEIERSTDVFPVKFLDMQHSHVTLHGASVLEGLLVGSDNLRLRCEQEIRNTLLRLRNLYLQRSSEPEQLQAALMSALAMCLTTLNAFFFLTDGTLRESEADIATAAKRKLKLESDTLHRLLDIRTIKSDVSGSELKRLFDEFTRILHRAAEVIDRFTQQDESIDDNHS